MPLSDRAYIRVPPDGAGKALVADMMIYIEYGSAASTEVFVVGDRVTGGASGTTARVVQVDPFSTTTGRIGVHLNFSDIADNFTDGEDLLLDGSPVAAVQSSERVYVSRNQIVGANNPNFGQRVDNKGAAVVRFSEGSPNLDAFGRTEVVERTWLGLYPLTYDSLADRFTTMVTGAGASETYDGVTSTVVLTTGTASGENVHRRSDLYHPYTSGVSTVVQMAVSIGDQGKVGVDRLWGYFDDDNGAYFELDGETLYVVLRSSTSGTVQEIRVPQSEWNGDRLDGSVSSNNPSAIRLDLSKMYLFTIDIQWYGAGPVRFGLNVEGRRVIGHTFTNAGDSPFPFMQSAQLPVHFEQVNRTAVGSTSQMRIGSSSVAAEGPWRPRQFNFSADRPIKRELVTQGERRVMVLARAAETFMGKPNRTLAFPSSVTVYSDTAPVQLSVIRGGTFSAFTDWYALVEGSMLEYAANLLDPGAVDPFAPSNIGNINHVDGGKFVFSQIIDPGNARITDLRSIFNLESSSEVRRNYNIADAPESFAFVVESLGVDTTVHLTATHYEVR